MARTKAVNAETDSMANEQKMEQVGYEDAVSEEVPEEESAELETENDGIKDDIPVVMEDEEELILPPDDDEDAEDMEAADMEAEDMETEETEAAETETEENGDSDGPEAPAAGALRKTSQMGLARNIPEGISDSDQRLISAGRRARRKIYKSKVVHTETGTKRYTRNNSKRRKEYLELAQSANSRKILTGTLTSAICTENNIVLAEIAYGDFFTIKIPAEFFCDLSVQTDSVLSILSQKNENATTTLMDIIHKRLGAPISFIVLQVDEKKGIAYASHVDAMVTTARENYTMRNGRSAKVNKGDFAEGTVMQINPIGIWVEVLGVETFIRNTELSWFRYTDVSTNYNVGDKITVAILDVEKHVIHANQRNLSTVKISASVRQTLPNPNELYYDKYQIGQSGSATVEFITDKDIFVVFANRITVRCNHPRDMEIPEINSVVMVKIVDKKDDGFLFTGQIRHIIRRPEIAE